MAKSRGYITQGVAEVLRMKGMILSADDDDQLAVCDLLNKLYSMSLSVKTLEATGIGKTVSALRKHPSKDVSRMACKLVKEWKEKVKEWIANESSVVTTAAVSEEVMATEKKFENPKESEVPKSLKKITTIEEKLEATKRKLQTDYNKAENMKKQRTTQELEVHDVFRLGLAPKHRDSSTRLLPLTRTYKTEQKKVVAQIKIKMPIIKQQEVQKNIDNGVTDVLRIKGILNNSIDETAVCDLLIKLQLMGLSVKTLKATGIGKTVNGLRKHPSKDVSTTAWKLVNEWREIVDEWIASESSVVTTDSEEVIATNLNAEKKIENPKESEVPNKSLNTVTAIEEKLESTKRKLQQDYNKVDNMKKLRRTQVVEVHDVSRLGLAPKHRDNSTHFSPLTRTYKTEQKKVVDEIKKMPMIKQQQLQKNIHTSRAHTHGVADVLRIKEILNKSTNADDESVVCDLLNKLQIMGLSVKTLKATGIGKTVNTLRKHPSKNVSTTACMLVIEWREMVDEWIASESSVVTPVSEEVTTKNSNAERKFKNPKESEVPNKSLNKITSIEEKLEATKRKLQQDYNKTENMKKQRRTQVLEVHDVFRLGLAPKHRDSRPFGKRKSSCVGLVH